ncbi:MAG: hypothetical protein JRJ09_14940 [Deltaproteobacteria bacterium]|nr:hypothetical protein [Deltaproteobacteria bacterium]MBW2049804.1 hypothetical protein [Deltaproteobacteria bacterium]MBW2111805.1 hypothetical protein [Deltaproteobacteria bacterium]MBW2353561.1 hypothetical protein [Deltaproteobacteria bacterium]HDZ89994.1 hypothetical protein [Deltaproteobacteria bacterium]
MDITTLFSLNPDLWGEKEIDGCIIEAVPTAVFLGAGGLGPAAPPEGVIPGWKSLIRRVYHIIPHVRVNPYCAASILRFHMFQGCLLQSICQGGFQTPDIYGFHDLIPHPLDDIEFQIMVQGQREESE